MSVVTRPGFNACIVIPRAVAQVPGRRRIASGSNDRPTRSAELTGHFQTETAIATGNENRARHSPVSGGILARSNDSN